MSTLASLPRRESGGAPVAATAPTAGTVDMTSVSAPLAVTNNDPSDTVASIVTVSTTPSAATTSDEQSMSNDAAAAELPLPPPPPVDSTSYVEDRVDVPPTSTAATSSSSSTATASVTGTGSGTLFNADEGLSQIGYERFILSLLESNMSHPQSTPDPLHHILELSTTPDDGNTASTSASAVASVAQSGNTAVSDGVVSLAAATVDDTIQAATLQLSASHDLPPSDIDQQPSVPAAASAPPEAMSVSPPTSPSPPSSPAIEAQLRQPYSASAPQESPAQE